MKGRKGISLIVLVITILVMIILAGVVVVTMTQNNPIEKAKTSKDLNNLASMQEELEVYKANRAMLGEEVSSVNITKENIATAVKNVPQNLKGKTIVTGGKLGVNYSALTEDAKKYAKEHGIFDAEDKTAPDADIYIEMRNGKKYVVCDGVDYETDVTKITCQNTGEVKNVDMSQLKVAFVPFDRRFIGWDDTEFFEKLKTSFPNIEKIVDLENADISKYNAFILNGGARWGCIYHPGLEKKIIDKFNNATKENPVYVASCGNDSATQNANHPLIISGDPVYEDRMLVHKKLVDNIITRQIDRWIHDKEHENYLDGLVVLKFKQSPYITNYYTDLGGGISPDNCAVYSNKEKGQGWLHMHTGPYVAGIVGGAFSSSVTTYKAAFAKLGDISSMAVDVTNATPGETYTFVVTDLAGNAVTKSIRI